MVVPLETTSFCPDILVNVLKTCESYDTLVKVLID